MIGNVSSHRIHRTHGHSYPTAQGTESHSNRCGMFAAQGGIGSPLNILSGTLPITYQRWCYRINTGEIYKHVATDSNTILQNEYGWMNRVIIQCQLRIYSINLRLTPMDQADYEMFKIVVIGTVRSMQGSSGIGKSNIALRFVKGEFKEGGKSTIGVEFMHKILTVNENKVKVTLWDTAGQEVYRALSKVYYKGALGVIIVYDVTSQKSYLDVEEWHKLAKDNLNQKDVVTIILGNKIDLAEQKVVPFDRVLKDYKQRLGLECFEVSARTGEGIQESIMYLIEQIYTKNIEPEGTAPPIEPMDESNMEKSEFRSSAMNPAAIRATIRPRIQVIDEEKQEQDAMGKSTIIIKDNDGKGPKPKDKGKKKKCSC